MVINKNLFCIYTKVKKLHANKVFNYFIKYLCWILHVYLDFFNWLQIFESIVDCTLLEINGWFHFVSFYLEIILVINHGVSTIWIKLQAILFNIKELHKMQQNRIMLVFSVEIEDP